MNIQLVKVTPADTKELQQLATQTFLDAFSQGNTPENMKIYMNRAFSESRLLEEINDPDSVLYFSKIGNRMAGYLKMNFGQAQTDVKDSQGIEIERIYVLQEFHGMKVGQVLMEKAVEIARENNAAYIWLGVWEKNPRAIRFYEKNGFVPFSTHSFMLGEDEQTDIMMKRVI